MIDPGTYTRYPALKTLPPLVRKQRKLAAKIAPIEPVIDQEKALRKDIDGLLVAAGLGKGEGVSCHGYDVTHRERKGATSLNTATLLNALVAAGLTEAVVLQILKDSTETADTSQWAEVKPCKGAKVRT